jgi:general secretion pathway protein K
MSARRSSPLRRERGTAVIMAMLIVAAVATLVSGALWRQGALLREAENELAYAQARWLIRGAIDWAGVILREDARTSSVDHRGEPWSVPLADTRLNENDGRPAAYLAGEIQDEQSKFNLRNLATAQGVNPRELQALRRLLEALSLEQSPAEAIAQRMLAALKSYGANQPALGLASVEELIEVEGLDAADKARLRPFVTVLPEITQVNANTAAAEVLASQLAGLQLIDARRLVSGRERAYFRDAADLRSRLAQVGVAAATDLPLAVSTRYFSVEGAVSYGSAQLRARALVRRDAARLETVWLQELG